MVQCDGWHIIQVPGLCNPSARCDRRQVIRCKVHSEPCACQHKENVSMKSYSRHQSTGIRHTRLERLGRSQKVAGAQHRRRAVVSAGDQWAGGKKVLDRMQKST